MIEKCVLTNLTIILVVVILVIVLFVRCVQSYIIIQLYIHYNSNVSTLFRDNFYSHALFSRDYSCHKRY